ncbi:MAG TPA: hypothetical protein VMD77_10390 [Candidatus Baltobacteraceae bacterium]|nr:hypothetical protein [Candidatus Baltobacteraceae bacterium]
MDVFESLVLRYLTLDPKVFVRWQHSIKGPDGGEWSCPDFVAIDVPNKRLIVVEVSSAWDITGLIDKVNRCDDQWFTPLEEQVKDILPAGSWKREVQIFVRHDSLQRFGSHLLKHPSVAIETKCLEDVSFPWRIEADRGTKAAAI